METSREDFGIAIRSAFLKRGTQQRFSLFVLIIISIALIVFDKVDSKPLKLARSIIKDGVFKASQIISSPTKGLSFVSDAAKTHLNLYDNYILLKKENNQLKEKNFHSDYLVLENTQLRKLIDEQVNSKSNFVSSRVIIDKNNPYLHSFIINSGTNKNIKNGMAVLDGANFVGRVVDVNFFTSRILLVSDLNSKIPVIISPSGTHAILSGRGKGKPTLDYLPENNVLEDGNKVFTSGTEGIFSPGIPIGKVKFENKIANVSLFSELTQITFINIDIGNTQTKN